MPLNTTDDKVIEYIFTGISNLIPNSWTNFYLADTMSKAIYIIPESADINSYWPYTKQFQNMTWYMPLAWGGFFAIGGLYWVRYWN
jgi:hypothetical protein